MFGRTSCPQDILNLPVFNPPLAPDSPSISYVQKQSLPIPSHNQSSSMAPTAAMLTLSHHHSNTHDSSQPISGHPPSATSSAVQFSAWRLLEALSGGFGKVKGEIQAIGSGGDRSSSKPKLSVSEAFEYGNFWGW